MQCGVFNFAIINKIRNSLGKRNYLERETPVDLDKVFENLICLLCLSHSRSTMHNRYSASPSPPAARNFMVVLNQICLTFISVKAKSLI